MPNHHPTEELLLDYAAGSLGEPAGLLVATHLALCPACRWQVEDYEAVGGAMLESIELPASRAAGLEAVLARLDELAPAEPEKPAVQFDEETRGLIPEPLRSYLGINLRDIAWRGVTGGLDERSLSVGPRGLKTRLMRMHCGQAMPRHTHGGTELVLVLDGGFADERGSYRRGDVLISDGAVIHRPVTDDAADCLCLVVMEGGLKLTGPLGRILNLFFRY